MSILEDLTLENRLSKGYWRVLVYLWQRHLAGDEWNSLNALGLGPISTHQHCEHLAAIRGLVIAHPEGGRYALSPMAKAAFGLNAAGAVVKPSPTGKHAFLNRPRAQQQAALKIWFDANVAREKLKTLEKHWRENTLHQAAPALLDLCERWAEKLGLTP